MPGPSKPRAETYEECEVVQRNQRTCLSLVIFNIENSLIFLLKGLRWGQVVLLKSIYHALVRVDPEVRQASLGCQCPGPPGMSWVLGAWWQARRGLRLWPAPSVYPGVISSSALTYKQRFVSIFFQ